MLPINFKPLDKEHRPPPLPGLPQLVLGFFLRELNLTQGIVDLLVWLVLYVNFLSRLYGMLR